MGGPERRLLSRSGKKWALMQHPLTNLIHIVHIHVMSRRAVNTTLLETLLDTCMCHKARMAARVVTRAYDDALRAMGLRATQISVLAAVGARGALSIKSLADTLQMERTTLTRNLRPLAERGYVLLAPEGRYRSRVLTLTPLGRAALLEALPLWENAQRALKRRLGHHRWPEVQQSLAALINQDHQGKQP